MNRKFLLFGVLGLFALALVSAALVDYLSNPVTTDIEVKNPLELKISDGSSGWINSVDLGSMYGGDTATVWIKEWNHASVPITTNIEIIINEDGVNNVCGEITSFMYYDLNKDPIWEFAVIGACQEVDGALVFRPFDGQVLEAGHVGNYKAEVTFAPNVEGSYTATVQHLAPIIA